MIDPRITLITLTGVVDLASERRLRADLSTAAGDVSRALIVAYARRHVHRLDGDGGPCARRSAAPSAGPQHGERSARDGPLQRLLRASGMEDGLILFRKLEAAAHVLSQRGAVELR
jgi:hypothetical protein